MMRAFIAVSLTLPLIVATSFAVNEPKSDITTHHPVEIQRESSTKAKHLEKLQKAIVSIRCDISVAAHGQVGRFYGTGFIMNEKEGIVATNAHIAGKAQVGTEYIVTLQNGRELEARVLYVDPTKDFAFLKVENLKKNGGKQVVVDNSTAYVGEDVTIIGKNENNHFSIQTGTVASPYEVSGTLPQQSIRISLNAQGGASGSPVFNDEGKVIAILFASNQVTSAFALPIKVVTDALELIQKGETPPRYSLGIVVDYKSTDEWVRHCNFPADQADNYVKKFSSAFNRMLVVNSAINQSPAQKSLQVGDVIMEANNQEIGPDLYLLDTIIDQAGHEEKDVELKIMRQGEELKKILKPYSLYKKEVRRILDFVGAYFFEADEEIIHRMGPKKHRVFICNLKPGSVLLENLPIHGGVNTAVAIVDIDGHSIETLDDIVKLIPFFIN